MVRHRHELLFFRPWRVAALCWGIVCGSCLPISAQSVQFSPVLERNVPILTAQEHPWARFLPQSWTRTRTITTTEQEGRKVRNIIETKTVLEDVGQSSLTLKATSTIEVNGRSVETPAQRKTVDFFQEPIVDGVKIEQRPSTLLTVERQLIPCEVRSYLLQTGDTRQRTTVWYSTQFYPYVLRVERILKAVPTEKNPEEKILSSSTTEILETAALLLRRSKLGTYSYRTIAKTGDITTITETFGSRHIPGGLLRETVRELNRDGKEIRSIETRMINYYFLTWAPPSEYEQVRPRRKFKEMEN